MSVSARHAVGRSLPSLAPPGPWDDSLSIASPSATSLCLMILDCPMPTLYPQAPPVFPSGTVSDDAERRALMNFDGQDR